MRAAAGSLISFWGRAELPLREVRPNLLLAQVQSDAGGQRRQETNHFIQSPLLLSTERQRPLVAAASQHHRLATEKDGLPAGGAVVDQSRALAVAGKPDNAVRRDSRPGRDRGVLVVEHGLAARSERVQYCAAALG